MNFDTGDFTEIFRESPILIKLSDKNIWALYTRRTKDVLLFRELKMYCCSGETYSPYKHCCATINICTLLTRTRSISFALQQWLRISTKEIRQYVHCLTVRVKSHLWLVMSLQSTGFKIQSSSDYREISSTLRQRTFIIVFTKAQKPAAGSYTKLDYKVQT